MDEKKLLEIKRKLQGSDASVDKVFDVESLTRGVKKPGALILSKKSIDNRTSEEINSHYKSKFFGDLMSVKSLIRDFERAEEKLKFEISSLRSVIERKDDEIERLKTLLVKAEGARALVEKAKVDKILNSNLYKSVAQKNEEARERIKILEEKIKLLESDLQDQNWAKRDRMELSCIEEALREIVNKATLTAARREFYERAGCLKIIDCMRLKDDLG